MTVSDSPPTPPAELRRPRFAWTVLLAALSGLLVFLSFPPADRWPLIWVALVPLLIALDRCRRKREALVAAFVFGLTFMGGFFEYLRMYGLLPWLALAVVEAAFYAPVGPAIYALWRRATSPVGRIAVAAACYTLIELLRGNLGNLSLTLGNLGYTQHSCLPILQLASAFGVLGITLVIVTVNASLAEALAHPSRQARVALAAILGVVVAIAVWGEVTVRAGASMPPPAKTYLVEAVQGNVDLGAHVTQNESAECARVYQQLTREGTKDADLIVWPESALPVAFDYPPEAKYKTFAADLAREVASYMLVGAAEQAPGNKIYNTAFLFDPTGKVVGKYRKDHLVMFGEYVPWRERLPFLQRYPIRMVDYMPGGPRSLVPAGDMRLGVLICFEGLFPEAIRDVCRRGAQVLAVITSDAWAEGTYEVRQHSATAVFPAVESRKWVVRAATTGRSAIISPYGQVKAAVPEFQRGTAAYRVPATEGLSICHRGGWAVPLVACGFIVLYALRRRTPCLAP